MSCNSATDNNKYVRFLNGKPSITQGSKTLLEFNEADLSSFFQIIDSYNVQTISLGASGATSLINQDMNFILVNASWPSAALESEKTLEIQVSDFDYVGGTGPLGATALSSEKMPFKDLFIINSVENHEYLQFTNPTKHDVTISLLTAKS